MEVLSEGKDIAEFNELDLLADELYKLGVIAEELGKINNIQSQDFRDLRDMIYSMVEVIAYMIATCTNIPQEIIEKVIPQIKSSVGNLRIYMEAVQVYREMRQPDNNPVTDEIIKGIQAKLDTTKDSTKREFFELMSKLQAAFDAKRKSIEAPAATVAANDELTTEAPIDTTSAVGINVSGDSQLKVDDEDAGLKKVEEVMTEEKDDKPSQEESKLSTSAPKPEQDERARRKAELKALYRTAMEMADIQKWGELLNATENGLLLYICQRIWSDKSKLQQFLAALEQFMQKDIIALKDTKNASVADSIIQRKLEFWVAGTLPAKDGKPEKPVWDVFGKPNTAKLKAAIIEILGNTL